MWNHMVYAVLTTFFLLGRSQISLVAAGSSRPSSYSYFPQKNSLTKTSFYRSVTANNVIEDVMRRNRRMSNLKSLFTINCEHDMDMDMDMDTEPKQESLNSLFALISRGGATTSSPSKEREESKDFFLLAKLKNVIRSMVKIGERKAPLFTKLWKKILIGIRLYSEEGDDKMITETITKSRKRKSKGNDKKKIVEKKKRPAASPSSPHLSKALKQNSPNYRIQRELKQFLSSPPPNLKLKVGKNIRIWIVTMTPPSNTIYAGEKYRLRIQFPNDYPTSPPSVFFLPPTPRHEHVYTNGDICLSLLGKDWRPTMTAQSLAISILSILSGAQRKSLPMDNVRHAGNKPGGRQDDWVYHDDNC